MYKLLVLSFLFTSSLFSQKAVYSGSDDKLKYEVKIVNLADQKNDNFYDYYSLEIKNISNKKVTFTPVFNYTTEDGDKRTTSTHGDTHAMTLASGESIKGHVDDLTVLTLFKEFHIGNSGKKSSNSVYILESITINY